MLSKNAITVLEKRYLTRNENGDIVETPNELFRRVAHAVSIPDVNATEDGKMWEDLYYQTMIDLDFLPNSPTLMNAGKDLGQLSACFVLPIEDSMEGIFDTVKQAALIHKSGGGTGFSFSKLRPKNDIVSSTKGISSGPVSFMEVFNSATEAIKQGGTRRGANMGCLRVDHPDIEEFITCKKDLSKLTNFNISVLVTDEFLQAVKSKSTYDLKNPHTGEIVKKEDANKIYNLIVHQAWESGEPGLLFIDTVNRANPTPKVGEIESTNPCGEQPLLPYEACNLGSINLSHFVKDGRIDYDRLGDIINLSVRFLDNIIDINNYPLPEIAEMCLNNRKIGLGIMGWADMLFQLKIPYDTKEACDLAEQLMSFIKETSHKASSDLSVEREVFPYWDKSIYEEPMRNAAVTTIAPTGTISMIAGCSSGIEPLFAIAYTKRVMDGTDLVEVNPYFKEVAINRGFYSEELMKKIVEKGTIQGMKEIPEDIQKIFVTAMDIKPEWHVRMQAAFQKYNDSATSKTVNLPENATEDDVKKVYELAYELGCKGVTVYRYGCREGVYLVKGKEDKKDLPKDNEARKRPDVTVGTTEKITTGCGNMYITINEDEEGASEIFAHLGKVGGCASSQLDSIGRLCSLSLRSGVKIEEIRKHLRGIRCPNPCWTKDGQVTSCADAFGIAIEHYLDRKNPKKETNNEVKKSKCPECGAELSHESGCVSCHSCGYSKCS